VIATLLPRRHRFPRPLLLTAVVLGHTWLPGPVRAVDDPDAPTLGIRHADEVTDVRTLLSRAEQGDARASFLLGTRYASGRAGVRDDSEAVRWFTRAAEQGLAEAEYNLGVMYATGRGVPRSLAEAARWYRRAAEAGVAEAQFNLGTLYGLGEGVEKDEVAAVGWLGRAAEQGLARAQYNLGILLEHGRGTRINLREALGWYRRAAAAGFEPARRRLSELERRLGAPAQTAPAPPAAPAESSAIEARAGATALPRIASNVAAANAGEAPAAPVPAAAPAPAAPAPGAAATEPASAGPRGPDWIRGLDPSFYTLQVSSHRSRERAHSFADRHALGGQGAIYSATKQGKVWYSVVYGLYASYDEARAAAADLPGRLRDVKPWVRNVGQIQKSMAP